MPKLTNLKPAVATLVTGPVSFTAGYTADRRLSRHARGYGTEWDKLRLTILKRDNHLCQCKFCKAEGRVSPATHVDHVIPKAQGGTDDPSNLQAINKDCHERKTREEKAEAQRLAYARR